MSRLEQCIDIVLGHEGGVSNHKADRGGLTNYGITQKTYDQFCKMTGRPIQPVTNIHKSEVEAIYSTYWKDAHCSYMPQPLDCLVFDMAIHSGPRRAVKTLQQALGVDADGICGRKTLDALHEEVVATSVKSVCEQYNFIRRQFLNELAWDDPSQEVFLDGWMNRISHLDSVVEQQA